jgi:DNA-binding NarL/FixJ family response regulator
MIRVTISIQDLLYAESLAAALSEKGRIECALVPENAVLSQARPEEKSEDATVILLDCNGASANKKKILTRLQYRFPKGRTILLTEKSDPALAAEHFSLGLCGVFPKTDGITFLKKAILAVDKGEIWACRETYSDLLKQLSRPKSTRKKGEGKGGSELTRREKEIIALVAGGLKNRQIGEKLHISERTVKVHLNNIFRKIEVEDRLQAALYAINKGLTPGKVLSLP